MPAELYITSYSPYSALMVPESIPGEAAVLHLKEVGLSITTRRILHRVSDSSQRRCFLEDVVLLEVARSESKGCLIWAALILCGAAATYLASLWAARWIAGDLRTGAAIGAFFGFFLLLLWYATRETVIRFKTAAGAIVVPLTGNATRMADQVVNAFEHARAGVLIGTPPTAAPPSPSALAP